MPPRPPTTTSFVILGQLQLRPWGVYELAQHMRRNLRYIWPRAESGVYAEAKALVARGFAEVTTGKVGNRSRSTYRITPKGRRALKAWLALPPTPGLGLDFEGLVRVFLGNFAERRDLLACVHQANDDAEELLATAHVVAAEYLEDRAPFQEQVHVRALVFDFLFTFAHMVRDWSVRTGTDLERWAALDIEQRRALGKAHIARLVRERPASSRSSRKSAPSVTR